MQGVEFQESCARSGERARVVEQIAVLAASDARSDASVDRAALFEGAQDLARLARAPVAELEARLALDRVGASRLAAAFELGRCVERASVDPRRAVADPNAAFRVLAPVCRGLDRETFQLLLLDGRHRLLRRHCVAVGTLTTSLVHPREVFGPALRERAAAVLVAHNHPSGDPEPSAEDRAVTRRLVEAGELLGVPLVDHLVLGDGRYVSLRRRMGF